MSSGVRFFQKCFALISASRTSELTTRARDEMCVTGARNRYPLFGNVSMNRSPRDTIAEQLSEPVNRLVDSLVEVDVSVWRPNGSRAVLLW